MPSIAEANAQIREAMRLQQERRQQRQRAIQPVRAIDRLIGELEALHLAGRKRVPEHWEDRLCGLNALLPPDLREELHARVTIVHLMDRLYAIQDELFARQTPRGDDGDLDQGGRGETIPRPSMAFPYAS